MEEDETAERLNNLSLLIRTVYLPFLESKTETKLHMEKFMRQISISKQQAYGNVTIPIPEIPNMPNEEICKNAGLIMTYQNTVVSPFLRGASNTLS